MKEFSHLFKLQLKLQFRSEMTKKQKIATPVAVTLAFLPLLGIICFALFMLVQSAVKAGIVAEILSFVMLSAQVFTLFFVSKVYISTFYNADDNQFLSTLPARPEAIFLSKLVVVYLSELAFSAVLLLPMLITSAVAMNLAGMTVSVVFYFFIPLAVLFAPIIPLVLISILSAPLMYIASFFKRRSAMSSIMGILVFILVMGAYFALIPNMSNLTALQNDLPQQAVNVFQRLANIVYFNKTFFLASLGIDFAKNFFIMLGITLGALLLSITLSAFFFRRSVSAQFETHTKDGETKLTYKSKSIVKALLQNDFKSLLRTPGLAINSFIGVFMSPLVIIMITMFTDGGFMGPTEPESTNLSAELMMTGFLMMYCFMLNVGLNYSATIAFTREGRSFHFLKHLPVNFSEVLRAKRLLADITSTAGIILLMLCAVFVLKLNAISVLAFGIISMIYCVSFNMYGIYRDMKRPKLDWTDVKQAINQNSYIMVPFFIALPLSIAAMVIASVFSSLTKYLHTYWLLTMFWGIMLIGGMIFYFIFRNLLYKNAEKLFAEMGEPKPMQNIKTKLPSKLKLGL